MENLKCNKLVIITITRVSLAESWGPLESSPPFAPLAMALFAITILCFTLHHSFCDKCTEFEDILEFIFTSNYADIIFAFS